MKLKLLNVLLAIGLGSILTSSATPTSCERGCEVIRLHYAIFARSMAQKMAEACLKQCKDGPTQQPIPVDTTPSTPFPTPPRTEPPVQPTGQPPVYTRCGQSPPTDRVMGGTNAHECEFPWMVALSISTWNCAGTIVDEWHILSAAHCFKSHSGNIVTPAEIGVRVGSSNLRNLRLYKVASLQVNRHHVRYINDYDVAVIRLQTSLTFGRCVRPICLPDNIPDVTQFDRCVVAGWGTKQYYSTSMSTQLQKAYISIVDQGLCATVFSNNFINSLKLCVGDFYNGGIDACKGDSGGPYMCERQGTWYQFGIVSFGVKCGLPKKPGVYTRVANPQILSFIHGAIPRRTLG